MEIKVDKTFFKSNSIVLDSFFGQESELNEEMIHLINSFCSYNSIKEALKNHFKISSSAIVKFCQENMIREEEDKAFLNVDYFLVLDSLSFIFSHKGKMNHADFLQVLNNHESLAVLAPYYNEGRRLKQFLEDNFQSNQIKEILLNTPLYTEIHDLTAMYMQDEDVFKNILKNLSFREKSSLRKCHDILAKHIKKIQTENFLLKQETHFPEIEKLKVIDKDYNFVIPTSHHDLIEWGADLGHCIGSRHYADSAFKGNCLLLGVEDKRKIKYTLEIKHNKINQIQGFSRSRPDSVLMNKINKKLKELSLIK